MPENEIISKTNAWLKSIGKEVFITILYPALKKDINIDSSAVCRLYPEFAKRDCRDNRLSSSRSIIKNGWEKYALTIIAESKRLDPSIIDKAKNYLSQIN